MLTCGAVLTSGCGGGSNPPSGPGNGGGTSNPVPAITSLSPAAATVGSLGFTLTVNGNQFISGSVVNWNGQARSTTFVRSGQLTVTIDAADIASSGSASVTVTNPSPGGGTSSSQSFTISAAQPPITTRTDWIYTGAEIDAADENYSYPPYLAFDSARNQVFLSVPASNVVKVYDTQTHAQKAEISIPSPYGIDISADGASVYVGTGTQFLYVLDPSTLHVKQILNSADAMPGGFSSVFVYALSDGTLFIMPTNSIDGGGLPLIWSLASGTASQLTTAPVIWEIARSGDHSLIFTISPVTEGDISVYSVAEKSFITTPYATADIASRIAANPVKDQFAVSDLDGNMYIYNSSLALLGQIRIEPAGQIGGQRLNGMVFSGDGTRLHLFVDRTIQEYDTGTFTQQTAMLSPYSLGMFPDPLPLTEDSTGLIFAIDDEGMNFIDVSNIKSSTLSAADASYGYSLAYLNTNTGPVSGGTNISTGIDITTGSEIKLSAAYLGSMPVWNFAASSNQYSFTTPSFTTPGPQNLTVMTADGDPLVAPLAFSYGPEMVRLVSTTSGEDGGGTGFLAGYGLGTSTSDLQITIGGQSAPVTQIGSYLSQGYIPAPIQSASFTIPKGTAGPADVTLTTSAGRQTLKGAFRFNPSTTLHATTTPLEAGVYDATRKAIYYTTTNQILTWSVASGTWLTPISVPSSGTAALTGISVSPNGQYVAAADQGNRAVVVFDPSTPQGIRSFPVSDGGFGLEPASVAVTNQGKVYFVLAFPYRGNPGGRCQNDLVWALDAITGATTDLDPATIASDVSFCIDTSYRIFVSTDGNTVYLDDGGVAIYDVPSGQWTDWPVLPGTLSGLTVLVTTVPDMAISADSSRLVSTFDLIDWSRGYLGVLAWSDLDTSDNQTLLMGEKMDRNGTILFQSFTGALDVMDLTHLVKQQRIALPYAVQDVFDPLVWDDDNDTAYMIVNGGLLEIPVTPPLILQSAIPSSGSAGTSATLKGSGFASGDTVTVDGATVDLTISDEHTATLVMPAHVDGAAVIQVTAPNGQSYSLDPGFIYGSISDQTRRKLQSIPPSIKLRTTPPGGATQPGPWLNWR